MTKKNTIMILQWAQLLGSYGMPILVGPYMNLLHLTHENKKQGMRFAWGMRRAT